MINRKNRHYNMFALVQTFGINNTTDLYALRLDLRNITHTTGAIDAGEPGFADKFPVPTVPRQITLLAIGDRAAQELKRPVGSGFVGSSFTSEN